MGPKLNPKQTIFVKEYLVDKNATRAAKAAGYSAKTAQQMGTENLSKPVIAAAIKEGLDNQIKKLEDAVAVKGLTKERWLLELKRIAFTNMDDFATVEEVKTKTWEGSDEDGEMVTTIRQRVLMVPTMERKAGRAHAIKKLTETSTQFGGSIGIELHDKKAALELIGRACGWVKDESAAPTQASNVHVVITLPSNGREIKIEKKP